EELNSQLTAFNNAQETAGIYTESTLQNNQKIAFLFTGQGSQYIDMGKELYDTQPVFRENCDRCFQLFDKYLDTSLKEIIFTQGKRVETFTRYPLPVTQPKRSTINETRYTQPAIFTIEYALAQMWMSWGIKPDVVTGHSIGEFVAATIAGVFSLEEAIKLVANRGKLMQELPPNGEIYAIQASEADVNSVIKNISGTVSIAAINTHENTVISGEIAAIEQAIAVFKNNKIKTTKLEVSHAFHSPLMESILPAFTKVAESVSYSPPQIPFVSNVTGEKINNSIATPQYWIEHICKPVRFAAGMKTLAQLKCNVFLEIGSKPILLGMGRLCLNNNNLLWLPSLRYGQSDWRSLLSTVASLYTNNINFDWASFYPDKRQILPLPTYPFKRQEYWLSGNKKKNNIVDTNQVTHLLGNEIKLAKCHTRIWQNKLSANAPAYLIEHQVKQQFIFPSAGYIEMVLKAGEEALNTDIFEFSNIDFQQPLILSESATEIQFVLNVEDNLNSPSFEILSLDNNSDWVKHSQGKVRKSSVESSSFDLTQHRQEIDREVDLNKYYQDLANRGLEYGNRFRAIAQLYSSDNRALGKIELPANLVPDAANYIIHPVLLDACLQVGGAAIDDDSDRMYLPIAIEKIVFNTKQNNLSEVWSYARLVNYNSGIYTIDFEIVDKEETIAVITGVKIKATQANLFNRQNINIDDWLYQVEWRDSYINSKKDNSFISLTELQKKAKYKFSELTNNTDFDNYLKLLSELEKISVYYIVNALIKLGVDFEIGQLLSPSVEQFSILEEHECLWSRLLDILTETGILESDRDIWQVIKVPDIVNTNKQQQQLLEQYPQAQAELDLLHRCASQLDKVMSGNIDPKELLFPGRD
ncbi:MAG: acyltransferase domain-containing protein, partial [Pleurocapsa sp.]